MTTSEKLLIIQTRTSKRGVKMSKNTSELKLNDLVSVRFRYTECNNALGVDSITGIVDDITTDDNGTIFRFGRTEIPSNKIIDHVVLLGGKVE